MSRTGWSLRDAGRPAWLAWPLLGLAVAAVLGSSHPAGAQVVAPPNLIISTPDAVEIVPPGEAAVVLPHDVQVVRFHGPAGMKVEVLSPAPEPVPQGDGQGLATVGMKVGNAYHLRVTDIPDRPGATLYPVVEIIGHLHRPTGVDPGKYPIRVVFRGDDVDEAVDRGLLVTQVIYLEDPDLAIPLKLDKDSPATTYLSPAEDPIKVAPRPGPGDGRRADRRTPADAGRTVWSVGPGPAERALPVLREQRNALFVALWDCLRDAPAPRSPLDAQGRVSLRRRRPGRAGPLHRRRRPGRDRPARRRDPVP